jgi:hypothetical protein
VGRKVLGRAQRSRRAAKKFSEEPLYSEGGPVTFSGHSQGSDGAAVSFVVTKPSPSEAPGG